MSFKKIIYIATSLLLIAFFVYLVQPIQDFPPPPSPSLQSDEPADSEDPLRRSYFLDLNREEIIQDYIGKLSYMPILRLNYPPEEAQSIIRDQTRSSYLEEITQPFRLSFYINGFVPSEAKDKIIIKNQNFEQKITVRYVPSSLSARLLVFLLISISSYALIESSFLFSEKTKKLWQEK